MELNILKLLCTSGALPESGTVEFDFTNKNFNAFHIKTPVTLSFIATPSHGLVELTVAVSSILNADCARCAGNFTQEWCSENHYIIREADLAEKVPDLPFTAQGMLNLKELAYSELVLEVPPILVCNEDCEGLCQHCGKPTGECKCPPEQEGDPRLQILKQLLTD